MKSTAFLLLCALAFAPKPTLAESPARPPAATVQPTQPTVAVMRLESSQLDSGTLDVLVDALTVELRNTGRVRMMERARMNTILAEQGFQQSGACDRSECAVEVGRLLSVDRLVLGTVGRIGETWSVTLRLVNVQTGEISAAVRDSRAGNTEVLLSRSVPKLVTGLVESMDSAAPSAVAMPTADKAMAEAELIVQDRAFRRESGRDRLHLLARTLTAEQSLSLYQEGKTSRSWAAANAIPLFPVGSVAQGDWVGVGFEYLAYVPLFGVASRASATAKVVLWSFAWAFQIGRPVVFANSSNSDLRKSLRLEPSAWIPTPGLQVTSSGEFLPAAVWTF